jgi:hypothetical protein
MYFCMIMKHTEDFPIIKTQNHFVRPFTHISQINVKSHIFGII